MYAHTVAEGDEGGSELVFCRLLDCTRCWHLGDERTVVDFMDGGFDVFCLYFCHPLEDVCFCWQNVAFLVVGEGHDDEVLVWHLLDEAIGHVDAELWHVEEACHIGVCPLDALHGFVVEEVAHAVVDILAALYLVAVEVEVFYL